MIDQDMAHQLGCDGKEVGAALPIQLLPGDP
jgi:hypothetical protein